MGKSRKEPGSAKKKPNTTGSYSPVQIKEGEILTDVGKKQWRIGKPIGSGGFGEIYLVSDDIYKSVPQNAMYVVKIEPHKSGPLFVEMNFYIRVAKQEIINKWIKERNLKHLGMPHYISFGSHFYQGERYRFLILKRFGQDLGKLFSKFKRKFHIKTVLTLGIQILEVLEYIHSHGYIHADIKASNLLLGYDSKKEDNVYLLDYGLACKYIDYWGTHKEFNHDQRKAHDGTLEYTSRDAHVGAHSRRGDLEVLAYNMIQWLSGKLPWENETSDPEKVAMEKNNCMNNIPLFLKLCFRDEVPGVLLHFLQYVVSLKFDTKPDYNYCKTLLKQGIRQAGYSDDGKLNLNSTPQKLKFKKRYRDTNIENLVELKPIKIPKTTARQHCVLIQQNCNRMTRQQTAANTPALRSRESFDWVKVLQSNPEKILKSQSMNQNLLKKRRNGKKGVKKNINNNNNNNNNSNIEDNLKKIKENPLDNPTPAMFEVLKLKNTTTGGNTGRRNRSDSNCSSPVFYEQNYLTPAMEEVIRRREAIKRTESSNEFRPVITATSARANRLRFRNESKLLKLVSQKPLEVVDIKKTNRKISAPETETNNMKISRGKRTRKYSLPDQSKFLTGKKVTLNVKLCNEVKHSQRTSQRIKKQIQRCRKCFPTLSKYVLRKKLTYNKKKKSRRREVSPSEINFVPRLRSGFDNSDETKLYALYSRSSKNQIRHYAAKDVRPKNKQNI